MKQVFFAAIYLSLMAGLAMAKSENQQPVSNEDFQLFDGLFMEKNLPLHISSCWMGKHEAITGQAEIPLYGHLLSEDEDTATALCKFNFDKDIEGYVIAKGAGTVVLFNKKSHQRITNIGLNEDFETATGTEDMDSKNDIWVVDLNNDGEPDILKLTEGLKRYQARIWRQGQFMYDKNLSQDLLEKKYRSLISNDETMGPRQ